MIARGLDTHKSDMLRIGHMGNVDKESLMATLSALVSSMMSNKETKMDSILEPLLQLK